MPTKNDDKKAQNSSEQFKKDDFSVLDPVGYVKKQQDRLRLRKQSELSRQIDTSRTVMLPEIDAKYITPR